ncbi:unnamed protein product [Linum tenue]|uniref:Arginine decarboxylase n=1 Tax=Linum tenue TaxID=586396 RepID=A0AAV0NLD3_9ROSI|nr:unnamed protein product [Linum tenue]
MHFICCCPTRLRFGLRGWLAAGIFRCSSGNNRRRERHPSSSFRGHRHRLVARSLRRSLPCRRLGRTLLRGLGLPLPLITRLPDVLKNRLESLQSAFNFTIQSQGYDTHYQGVYPVKCNQERFIVEDIVNSGRRFDNGWKPGRKPELLLAMSCLCKGNPEFSSPNR